MCRSFHPYPAKLIYTNFQPLEVLSRYRDLIYSNFQPLDVLSRYRDPQPQVAENYL